MTDKLENIARSMRQWVERIEPIPSHEVVLNVGLEGVVVEHEGEQR